MKVGYRVVGDIMQTSEPTKFPGESISSSNDLNTGNDSPPRTISEKWRRSLLILIVSLFVIEFITGVLLMLHYAPAVQTAWGSVWHIQTQVPSGWLVRGIHHHSSNALIVVVACYAMMLLFQRAYTGNRAWPWRLTCGLWLVTAALSLSGFLLPWDQWAYWGTQVRANILATTPFVGDAMRDLLLGPDGLGQATLTRFYTLHVIVLPCLCVFLLVGIFTARKWLGRSVEHSIETAHDGSCCHGLSAGNVLVVSLFVGGILAWTCYAHETLGWTLLDAPADPSASDYPARPEWYALFLYQWLKYFETPTAQIVGAIVVPTVALIGIMLAPNFVNNATQKKRHTFVVVAFVLGVLAATTLTILSLQEDRQPSTQAIAEAKKSGDDAHSTTVRHSQILRAATFHEQRRWADWVAKRSFELANKHGIPVEGPLVMLARDPQIQGPKLFAAHCASCHRYDGHDGRGKTPDEPATSSDLADFGSFERIRGFLREPMHPLYFGRMKKPDGEPAHTKMQRWLEEQLEDCESESERNAFEAELDDVARFLALQAKVHGPDKSGQDVNSADVDSHEAAARGRRAFMATCNECHTYQGQRSGTSKAPELYAYASWSWIFDMITDASHNSLYRARGREPAQMPSFQDRLSDTDRKILAKWLSGH